MTRAARPDLRRQRGFTLLELLIALTLLGLISAMAFSGLRLGTRAWEVADEREHDVYLVQQLLRAHLGAAYLPEDSGFATAGLVVGPDGPEPPFEGGPDHVSFIAPLPDRFGVAGLYRVTVELAGGGDRRALVMSWRLYRPPEDGGAREPEPAPDDRNRRVLLDGIEDAAFAYFGPAEEFGDPLWQDSWLERPDLPALVRVELAHPEKPWPPLIVATRLGPPAE